MDSTKQLTVILYSFGYKYGPPFDVNLLWDVRFLPNPYWVPELRPKDGRDPEVAGHVVASAAGQAFLQHLAPLLQFLIKENLAADKKTLRIAIGCTGGRHRSVAVTEEVAAILRDLPVRLTVFHRDIAREA